MLGVLSCVAQPALLCLVPAPLPYETARRFDEPPVPLPALLSRPRPLHRLYSEQQRGAFHGSLGGLKTLDVVCQTLGADIFRSAWCWVFLPSHRPKHHPAGQPLIGRPLYGPREYEPSFADCRLDALALCLFEGIGARHEVVRALSALEANDP